MIEVKNLVKRYGDHYAVDHLSFTVEKGCVCGFLGPNGAGKSTTMNMMTGYLAPTEGEVRVDGHSVTQDPAGAKACIGYLPEQPPLYVDMTVREYLEFAAGLKRIPRGERAAQLDRILEMTRTADVSGRLIRNLSKGYRQRVGLAQALIGFPHILILDEPTVGLDALLRLTPAEGADPREAVFRACAGADLPILEMRRESLSLEQIFLELTSDASAAGQAGGRRRPFGRRDSAEPEPAPETAITEHGEEAEP